MIDVKTKWISALVFSISPEDLKRSAHETALVIERNAPLNRGFIEALVMANEAHTQLLLISQWESREAWSAAQWDENLSAAITSLVQTARTFEFHTFEPIAVVRVPGSS